MGALTQGIVPLQHLVRGDMYRKSFQETGDTTDSCWSAGTVMLKAPCEEGVTGQQLRDVRQSSTE